MLSIQQARKLLGNSSQNLSDIEVVTLIESAELLKNLFFDIEINSQHYNCGEINNKINNDEKSSNIS